MNHLSFAGRDAWANAEGSRAAADPSKYRGPPGRFWRKLRAILPERVVFRRDKDGPMLIAGSLAG